MEDWNAPKHQWPSQELVNTLDAEKHPNPRQEVVRAVWNAVAGFASIAHWVEGGSLPLADNKGKLNDPFAARIFPALKLPKEGEASTAFSRLVLRDLTTALAASGEAYGPETGQCAYLSLNSRGELICRADTPGYARSSYKSAQAPLKVA